jgi:hypothetical protein
MRGPHNNEMQLTRSGHPRWRPSQLISVLYGHQWGHGRASVAGCRDRSFVARSRTSRPSPPEGRSGTSRGCASCTAAAVGAS